jgi:anti-sigma factor RsiW
MRCDEVKSELVAYLDGELTPEVRDCIDSHLASCSSCRAESAALDSTCDLLSLIGGETKSSLDIAGNVLKTVSEGDPWCRHIVKELTAYLDDELTEAEARPVREHLLDCENCREVSEDLRSTGTALERWTFDLPKIDLVSRILPDYRPGRRVFRLGSLAAAACLLLAVGIAGLSGAFSTDLVTPDAAPPDDLLLCMDLLDADTLDLLEDHELFEMADEIEWLDSMDDEELALLNGSGG